MKQIKVIIIDDSALVRQTLFNILNSDPEIMVIATAADPLIAVKKIARERPDLITLDLDMPKMDRLTFLRKLMSDNPIPVVVISNLTTNGTEELFQAFKYGALEVIA